ncbi:MAG TPA: polysaccharide lyase family protein [Bryobacteraceae bacterium]|nr:polysaccharide lyase family protein [Bryobacteraceae bacterium]
MPILSASGQTRTVWQIGKFDESPFEFSLGAQDSVTFQAGKSVAEKDWPRRQETGHPYSILFELPSVHGAYTLRINTLIEQPRIPALRVDINGHSGTFFEHPKLSYSRSDFTYAFDPHESQDALNIDLPEAFLKPGQNTLTITCVGDPPTPSDEKEIGGITYDALALEQDFGASRPREAEVSVQPTIFYHATPEGLNEVVDAFVRFDRPSRAGSVELKVNGHSYRTEIKGGEFGESRTSFDVPEWTGAVKAEVRLSSEPKRLFELQMTAQRKWTILVVPHTHLDVGYTDYQGKVAETQARVLTQADELIREHPDFRFSMDGSWNLEQLLSTRPKAMQDEILNSIRTGKMALPAQNCNLLTGYASLETLYRSLYASKEIAARYGLPLEYANITDVPTYSGSYPSVLASSGIKYWVAGANNDRAPIFYYDHWNELSPFWWVGPDGKKVLFWYSRHYMQVQTLFGLPPQFNAIRESLPIYLQAYSRPSYKLDVALLFGTQVENTDLFPSTATFADEWDKRHAYPKLTYATFPDFFHYIEQHHSKDLASFQGDGGGYWEDGIGSDAFFEQEDRENQNRALSAEILSTTTHSVDHNLNPPSGLLADIWENIILFSEHTWASYNSVSQPNHDETVKQLRVKDDRAERANLEIEDVIHRSMSQLANDIHVPANTLVVFNSLNWRRDLVVETDLFEHPKLINLATEKEVPLEVLGKQERFLHVRFIAKDVPGVGYRCFRIEYGKEGGPPEAQRSHKTVVENAFYRVIIDSESGVLSSIYDKQLGREIVDANSPYKFGQYIYVTGGDGDTQIINPFPGLPPAKLTVHKSTAGKYLGAEEMPWGESISTSSSSVNTPLIETEILLFNDQKKIEFRYKVHKNYTTRKEGVYFAFPVAVEHPDFTYATQQQWIDPAQNLMKGGSLEWFNIQHWMAVRDSNIAVGIVPIDASLASFGDINRGTWPGTFTPKTGTLFSYVMNNYWHTNYRAGQGGDFTFRYTVTSAGRLDDGGLTRLAMEEMRPAELDDVVSQDKPGDPLRPLPAEGEGFLQIAAENVALITWKKAEDGKGTILRLQEIAGKPTVTTLRFPHTDIVSAQLCSGVEDNLRKVPVESNDVRISFEPFEVLTVRVVEK